MRISDLRNRILWFALLSIVIAVAVACRGGAGEGDETPTPGHEASSAPTATPAPTITPPPTGTFAPTRTTPSTSTTIPTAPAGPLQGGHLLAALRNGGYIIYIRHAATDPIPDDADPVVLSDCDTQRNLSTAGRAQAHAIGQEMERLEIPVGRVLSSPFCRALDTARLAFGKATLEPQLENLETSSGESEREARINGLRRLLSTPPDGATNSVLVSHGFNISAAADVTIAEGEAAIFRPDGEGGFTLIATVTSEEWVELTAALQIGGSNFC